ncbi:MAG: hypothetical protein RLY20_1273 [Verrucomicrobiota bacterium]
MAVKTLGSLVVLLWVVGSLTDLPHWRSTYALWERAVAISPDSPRARLNFGIEQRKAGEIDAGVQSFVIAAQHADAHPNPAEIRGKVRAQLNWLVAFGNSELCRRPDVQPYCY